MLKDISIVIPAYNEEENIKTLCHSLQNVINRMEESFEIIIIDDGSVDNTFEYLKQLNKEIKDLKVVRFRANFGQTAALSAGFDIAQGKVIITMDADLQNDPEDMPLLIEKMKEGYDVVSGWRKHRKDPLFFRKLPSWFANKLISFITGVRLHDYGCTLKSYNRDIIKDIELYGQMHRFIPALAKWVGATVTEVEVNHYPRKAGYSKYGLTRIWRVLLDLITVKFLLTYSTSPIQVFGTLGLGCGTAGFGWFIYLVYQRFVARVPLANRPAFLISIVLILVGMQFISMGLLGELLIRTYHESQNKPIYIVKELLN